MYELQYNRLSANGIVHRQVFIIYLGARLVAQILGKFGGDYYNFKITRYEKGRR